ncbi:hypothetical protein D3C80_2077970 [compost metagenome]
MFDHSVRIGTRLSGARNCRVIGPAGLSSGRNGKGSIVPWQERWESACYACIANYASPAALCLFGESIDFHRVGP